MESTRERIAQFIGLPPIGTSPTVQVVDQQSADGYTRSLLSYVAPDGDPIEAFLFEPLGKTSVGGVLALHQHNSQWSLGKSEIAGLSGDPMQALGPALARSGIAVLAPDTIGFESRLGSAGSGTTLAPVLKRPGDSAEGWLQYYNHMAHRLVRGDLLMTKMLQDGMTGVAVLQKAVPDRSPVGVIGHSMGGGVALFLSALDTRVAFTCSSGAVGSYRHKLARGIGIEMAHVIPGFAVHFDTDDLLRCIAPRRLLVVSADDDVATADATELVAAARPTFEAVGCGEHLTHLRSAGGHGLDQQRFDGIVTWVVSQFETAG
jgi:dienelactone hydrolase